MGIPGSSVLFEMTQNEETSEDTVTRCVAAPSNVARWLNAAAGIDRSVRDFVRKVKRRKELPVDVTAAEMMRRPTSLLHPKTTPSFPKATPSLLQPRKVVPSTLSNLKSVVRGS